jgi:hypothetical protein
MAIMAMTTNNSIKVKPVELDSGFCFRPRLPGTRCPKTDWFFKLFVFMFTFIAPRLKAGTDFTSAPTSLAA